METGASFLCVVGLAIVVAMLVKAAMERAGLPPLVGYLALGGALRWLDDSAGVLGGEASRPALELMAEIGLTCLLFRVGLESDLSGLRARLGESIPIWIANVTVSALLGFAAARWLLGLQALPALFAAAALSATSLGIPAAVWEEAGAIRTRLGERFLVIAELDDISAIALMGVLTAVAPLVVDGRAEATATVVASTVGWLLVKGLVFAAGCWLFSRFVERRVTSFFNRFERQPDPLLAVLGLGLVIAALSALLGFSIAIGAFFAGLLFSRDPEAIRVDASFKTVYDLFTPFFFLVIGLQLVPTTALAAGAAGAVLLAAAVVGKLAGTILPAWRSCGAAGALTLGVSMVPRAEIALIVARSGARLGPEVVPEALYGGLVLTAAVTCLVSPIVLRRLLARGVGVAPVPADASIDGERHDTDIHDAQPAGPLAR